MFDARFKEGTMRSLIAILLTALVLGTVSVGSAKPRWKGKHHQEVEVQINHEKAFSGFKIKFIDMIEDSRCPRDTTCVWAGNAKVSVQVSKKGKKKISELNSNMTPHTVSFEGYEFKLTKLTPEPASNIRIRKDGYVATIAVVRKR